MFGKASQFTYVEGKLRPKRFAFFIDAAETAFSEIDEIVRFCSGIWGGRSNIIIPTRESAIAPDWWKLLTAFDPDYVVSLSPIDSQLDERLHKDVSPFKIIQISASDRERSGGNLNLSRYESNAVGIYEIPHYLWSIRPPIDSPEFLFLKGVAQNSIEQSFVTRNFGNLPEDISTIHAFRELPVESIKLESGCAKVVLEKLTKSTRFRTVTPLKVTMGALASHRTPYNDDNGLRIVVGDTVSDFAYFWNRVHLLWEGADHTLWMPRELAGQTEIRSLVIKYIERNWNAWESSFRVHLVSTSLEESELAIMQGEFGNLAGRPLETIRLTPDTFPMGESSPHHPVSDTWNSHIETDIGQGTINLLRPKFATQNRPHDGWCVDFAIDFKPQNFDHTNVQPKWIVPKRAGMARAFFSPPRRARATAGGSVCTEIQAEERSLGLRIPGDHELFSYVLDQIPIGDTKQDEWTPGRFGQLSISNQGRYFSGLLDLFGGLRATLHHFFDPFWRKTFSDLSGRKVEESDCAVSGALEILFKLNSETGAIENHRDQIGAARAELERYWHKHAPKPEINVVTKEDLRAAYLRMKQERKNISNDLHFHPNESFEKDRWDELSDLIALNVLIQGSALVCRNCGSKPWYSVEELKPSIHCKGCGREFPLPPSPTWSFRLNDLVGNAIAKHSLLPILQTLAYLSPRIGDNKTMCFLPPHDLFERSEYGGQAFSDIDVLSLVGKELIFAEVKSDPKLFAEKDFKKGAEICAAIKPDFFLFASGSDFGSAWPVWFDERLTAFESEVTSHGVKAKKIGLNWD